MSTQTEISLPKIITDLTCIGSSALSSLKLPLLIEELVKSDGIIGNDYF